MEGLVVSLIAALVIPAFFAAWLTLRMDRPGPARWLALALGAAAVGIFGVSTQEGQEVGDSLTAFLLSLVFVLPAAIGTLVGSVIGSFMLLYRRE